MKKKTIILTAAALTSSNVFADEISSIQVAEKYIKEEINKLKSDKDSHLPQSFDGSPLLDFFKFDQQFDLYFPLINNSWEKFWYDGGFFIYPEGASNRECLVAYIPGARGSLLPNGERAWVRDAEIMMINEGCEVSNEVIPAGYTPSIIFNNNNYENMLEGDLAGAVLFMQAHIVPAKTTSTERRMHLVSNRLTKVMFKPEDEISSGRKVTATVKDKQGNEVGQVDLLPPESLPMTVLALGNEYDVRDLEFTYDDSQTLKSYDLDTNIIQSKIAQNDSVMIHLWDGHWTPTIKLEKDNPALNGKTVIINSNAGYGTTIMLDDSRSTGVGRGSKLVLKNVQGKWIHEGEVLFNNIGYSDKMWSANLPAEWIAPGMSVEFKNGSKTGLLTGVKVGAPTELLINTIDVGMLVEPRRQFNFQYDRKAQQEYLDTIPVSKMIVNEYEAVKFEEVMLPDGTLLTDFDPSKGGWHTGTMRQRIGKELISIGINNANYGINSSIGIGEGEHPYIAAQITAHNTRGQYSNGLQTHGGSGGGGIVTLDDSLGNEMSHEVGHNYGLWHNGGEDGSIHRPAHQTNSTWGWDTATDRFVPNFSPSTNGGANCSGGSECAPAFNDMFTFGNDAMAGGWAMYGAQRFTMYTPQSMSYIQSFLESKVIFDKTSSTGFRKWNVETETMDEYSHEVSVIEETSIAPHLVVADYITEMFTKFDVLNINMSNGYWARNIEAPKASEENKGKALSFNISSSWATTLDINDSEISMPYGTKRIYVSNGSEWVVQEDIMKTRPMIPKQFGVPVTTLVGYYDPQKTKETFIYPALHGSYGMVYSPASEHGINAECKLEVELKNGDILNFALKKNRVNSDNMNKFHVNVAQADEPQFASVICGDDVLDTLIITGPKRELTTTINSVVH